ncbi:MAG: hypothetical protein K0Q72_1227 [Armatimonadetes bacterium]|jgi:hypothetical protein|nr:hypothetical protein [Armatimonadota bacterium]
MGIAQAPVAQAAAKRLYLAVHDSTNPNLLHTYSVGANGSLTALAGSPLSTNNTSGNCGGYCQTLGYSASRKLLFTTGGAGVSVTDFSSGAPVLAAGSPFFGSKLDGLAVVEKGRNTYVYCTSYDNDQVMGLKVLANRTLQALPQPPTATPDGPDGITAVKDMVFVANENARTITSYKVAADGALTPAPNPPTVPGDSFVYNVNVDPKGKYLYAGDCDNPQIFVFKINPKTAGLTPVSGSPFATDIDPVCSGVLPTAKSLFFALTDHNGVNGIQALKGSSSGRLQKLGGAQSSVDADVRVGAVDSKARFLATMHQGSGMIRTFTVNKKTGVVTPSAAVNQPLSRVNAALFVEQ